jgi:hypothetical protein
MRRHAYLRDAEVLEELGDDKNALVAKAAKTAMNRP